MNQRDLQKFGILFDQLLPPHILINASKRGQDSYPWFNWVGSDSFAPKVLPEPCFQRDLGEQVPELLWYEQQGETALAVQHLCLQGYQTVLLSVPSSLRGENLPNTIKH